MYNQIVSVNISLDTAAVSSQGFGTALWVTNEAWFPETIRAYQSVEQAALDLPTDSAAYLGVVAAFRQPIKPTQVKVAKSGFDSVTFTVGDIVVGQTVALTVTTDSDVTANASFTLTDGETKAEVAEAIVADLGDVEGISITDNEDGSFTLTKEGEESFYFSDIANLAYEFSSGNSAEDILTEIQTEDDDWYFIGCSDHSDAFVMSMANAIESREKLYFVTLAAPANLGAYSETAMDTLSKLRQEGYERTVAWYHDQANETYPEMEYIATLAGYDAGKKVIANSTVSHRAARDISTGKPLSVTQKNNLTDKNASFTETVGGVTITRYGTVSNGKWADEVRDRDFMVARTREALQNFLINKPKVPYTDDGINEVRGVLSSTYSRYVSAPSQPNVLQPNRPFEISLPRRQDVSFADITSRTLNGQVTLYLSGAILEINIIGSATIEAQS